MPIRSYLRGDAGRRMQWRNASNDTILWQRVFGMISFLSGKMALSYLKDNTGKAHSERVFQVAPLHSREISPGLLAAGKNSHLPFWLDKQPIMTSEPRHINCHSIGKQSNMLYKNEICFYVMYNMNWITSIYEQCRKLGKTEIALRVGYI